jgi:hypothetical protein
MKDGIRITKLDAAGRQLEAAVYLFFTTSDAVSVHTLVSAAYEVLRAINEKHGGGFMVKDIHKYVAPERSAEIRERMARSQNFIKHADRDPDGEIEFSPAESSLPLFEAIIKYRELTNRLPPTLGCFLIWFALENRDIMSKNTQFAAMIESIEASSPPREREAFYRYVVAQLQDEASGSVP